MKKLTNVFFNHLQFLFILFSAAFCFSSCSKSTTGPYYHITCSVNDTPRTFNANAFAFNEGDSIGPQIVVSGMTDHTFTSGSISFAITQDSAAHPIATGIYTDTSTLFQLDGSYTPNSTMAIYEAGTEFANEASAAGVFILDHLTIIVTSISTEEIQGTFSGDFYRNGNPALPIETITDGDFYIRFHS